MNLTQSPQTVVQPSQSSNDKVSTGESKAGEMAAAASTLPEQAGQRTSADNDNAQKNVIELALSDQYVRGIWMIASKVVGKHDCPDLYPHITLPGLPYYVYHDSSFWTSGFFPGSIWILYQRSLKTPLSIPSATLLETAKKWQFEIAKEQYKTDNHDLGFMIMPSFARDWELTGCRESLDIVLTAARSLATRFSARTGVIKSWAGARTKVYELHEKNMDYLVVIDSMMNLDLLYYAAKHTGDQSLADMATTHAKTTLDNHVRANWSTYHLINYDAEDGSVRNQLTCQGYADDSTWARGQAWALYGYATVYKWTGDTMFLDAAIRLADYFLSRVEDDGTVYWDFDAPRPGVWDVSAAMCATSGLLLLQQIAPDRCSGYMGSVLLILNRVMTTATSTGDALFERSSSNDNPQALHRLAEHGCVYADYYFLETGNRLLEMTQGYMLA